MKELTLKEIGRVELEISYLNALAALRKGMEGSLSGSTCDLKTAAARSASDAIARVDMILKRPKEEADELEKDS